jgi:lycopene cyclase domain-containing protein
MLIFTLIPISIIWVRYYERLVRNRHIIVAVAALSVIFQVISDPFAESWHAWFFDPSLTLGIWIGNFPIENTIFFVLVSVAIASFVVARSSGPS